MSEKLFDALETCLQALESGETVDSALMRFPTLAAELRPILETSLQARTVAGLAVPAEGQRRGRTRLLRRAAELREAKRAPRRSWLFSFRPAALTFVLAFFLLSGTSLVRAASSSLPGDNLYPVKRTWEDVRLAFVSGLQEMESLELEYETERVDEINQLIARGRAETVSFNGYLNLQPDGTWTVAGIPIIINADTNLPANPLSAGMALRVTGTTDSNGSLVVQSLVEAPAGSIVPDVEDDGHEDSDGDSDNEGGSGSGSDSGSGVSGGDSSAAEISTYRGILETIDGNRWVVNGVEVDVSGAIIDGVAVPGAELIMEGYFIEDGVFVATQVTFSTSGSGENGNSGNENGSDDIPELEEESCSNSGSGSPCDDNGNENENDNSNDNEDDNEPPDN